MTDAGILVTFPESSTVAKALLAGVSINPLGAFIQVFLVPFRTCGATLLVLTVLYLRTSEG
jgi:hypothetical protein